jgi:hypothetical protein
VTATPVPGSGSAARTRAARGRVSPYQSAQRVVMLAGRAALPQPPLMDDTEHWSAFSAREDDFDLHQARRVDDDAVELLAVPDESHELAFVKRLH